MYNLSKRNSHRSRTLTPIGNACGWGMEQIKELWMRIKKKKKMFQWPQDQERCFPDTAGNTMARAVRWELCLPGPLLEVTSMKRWASETSSCLAAHSTSETLETWPGPRRQLCFSPGDISGTGDTVQPARCSGDLLVLHGWHTTGFPQLRPGVLLGCPSHFFHGTHRRRRITEQAQCPPTPL